MGGEQAGRWVESEYALGGLDGGLRLGLSRAEEAARAGPTVSQGSSGAAATIGRRTAALPAPTEWRLGRCGAGALCPLEAAGDERCVLCGEDGRRLARCSVCENGACGACQLGILAAAADWGLGGRPAVCAFCRAPFPEALGRLLRAAAESHGDQLPESVVRPLRLSSVRPASDPVDRSVSAFSWPPLRRLGSVWPEGTWRRLVAPFPPASSSSGLPSWALANSSTPLPSSPSLSPPVPLTTSLSSITFLTSLSSISSLSSLTSQS